MNFKICERSQKSIGSSSSSYKFGGPDTYVALLAWEGDVIVPYTLNRKVLSNRGIKFYYCGEGYSKRQKSKNSMLNRARQEARDLLAELNTELNTSIQG